MTTEQIRILLVEDDEDDYVLTKDVISQIVRGKFQLEWTETFQRGLDLMTANKHDIYLVDYRLGAQNGIALLQQAIARGCQSPIILLTGQGEHEIDMAAMKAGAADYLVKSKLEPGLLERSIRHALERKRAEAVAAFEHGRLAAFGAEVGLALTGKESLQQILAKCSQAMSQYLNASFAQILTYNAAGKKFQPSPAAGTFANSDDPLEIAMSLLNAENLAQGKPVFIKDVRTHEKLLNNPWIELEEIASFAAHPLIIEEQLVGVMFLFSQMPLAESIVNELSSVANGVALCVDKHMSKQALDQSEEERASLEAQYRHAQKLESIGQLAAGIAHDFNNILTVIQGHVDLLLARDDTGAVANQLKQVSAASQRAASLTRQLLMFSRKQVLQVKIVDLNTILRNLEKMLSRLLGEDVALKMKLLDGIPFMDADVGMIEQVVMNLVVNARDAMPQGGALEVVTSQVEFTKTNPPPSEENAPGKYLRLCISDNGSGMGKETLARIFEPFFTTKQVGKGTGLGLATAYGIVKQHHGWIDVESELGKGTTFKIYIPASTKKTSNHETEVLNGQIGRGRGETILVVEDEADLRSMVKESLQTCGYNVLEASNGVEALKIWDGRERPVDLLFTDIVMPQGMSGFELAEQIRRRKTDVKVIFTSGYSAEISGLDMTASDKVFLPKPYTLQKLTGIVRECLDKEEVAAGTANGKK